MITPNCILHLEVFKGDELKEEDLLLFKYIRPEPEYIIIGAN